MMRRLAGACLIAGAVLAADGVSIYAKARLAQLLLFRAWRRTLAGDQRVKPWPWADTWPVARLRIGGEDSIVLEGTSGRSLAFGPGHVSGTSLPGKNGNCVLSAHRDTQFAVLRNLRPGDPIELQTLDGQLHRYTVRATAVIQKYETWVLAPSGRAELTLITCYPFDAVVPRGPQRYAIFAEK